MVKMLVSKDHSPDVALLFQGEAATQGASVQGQVAVDKERGEAGTRALDLMGAKDTQVHIERLQQGLYPEHQRRDSRPRRPLKHRSPGRLIGAARRVELSESTELARCRSELAITACVD